MGIVANGRWIVGVGLLTACLSPSIPHAAAWTQKEDDTFLAFNTFYYHTSKSFDLSGNSQQTDPFTKVELNPYFEYGLTDRLTLGASPFLQVIRQRSRATGDSENNIGLAEAEIFARWKVWEQGAYVTSLQPLLKLPSLYSDRDGLKAGRSQMDVELSWMNGYGFDLYGEHHFLMGDVSYRRRLGVLEDQLKLHLGLGIGLSDTWTMLPQLYQTIPIGTSASNTVSVSGQNDYSLTKLQLSAIYTLNDATSVEIGGFAHVAGKSTGEGGGALVSVWKRW